MKLTILYGILLCLPISLFSNHALAKDLFVFGADWCPACVKLKNFIKSNPKAFEKYNVESFDID